MRRVWKVLGWLLNAVLVLAIAFGTYIGVTSRRSPDGIPTAFGRKILTVLSGSMEPTIHVGDVILVRPLTPSDQIRENDIITFRTKENANMLITHRVMGAVAVNGETKSYVTKGDANGAQDMAMVSPSQIVGRYAGRVPYFGYVSAFLHKPLGVILFVILPGVILIGIEFRKVYRTLAEDGKGSTEGTPGGESREE